MGTFRSFRKTSQYMDVIPDSFSYIRFMARTAELDLFLAHYNEQIVHNAVVLREVILATLPEITEQVDLSAKMIAYCYGQKYAELICVIIPSKKGLKLGFNRGSSLPDPNGILKGTGKISRYIEVTKTEDIHDPAVKELLKEGLKLYKALLKP